MKAFLKSETFLELLFVTGGMIIFFVSMYLGYLTFSVEGFSNYLNSLICSLGFIYFIPLFLVYIYIIEKVIIK